MANGGIDFHGIDAERAIAGYGNDLPLGERQSGGDGVRNTDTEASKRSGVHIRARTKAYSRKAQYIASISDRDVVGIRDFCDSVKNAVWVHFPIGFDDWSIGLARLRSLMLPSAQTFCPGFVRPGCTVAGCVHQCIECQFRGREYLWRTTAIVEQFARGICDANKAGVRKNSRRTIAELVVEPPPNNEDDIGVLHDVALIAPANEG